MSNLPPPKILKGFQFVDDSRTQRWPDEWFDGEQRELTPAHLRVELPATKEGKKALRMRRQSLRDTCDRRGLVAKFNWRDGNLIMQVVGKSSGVKAPVQAVPALMNSGPPARKQNDGPTVSKAKKGAKKNVRK